MNIMLSNKPERERQMHIGDYQRLRNKRLWSHCTKDAKNYCGSNDIIGLFLHIELFSKLFGIMSIVNDI